MFMIEKLMQIGGEMTWDFWLSDFCTWVTDILHGWWLKFLLCLVSIWFAFYNQNVKLKQPKKF